jgi:hypothetical protein
VEETEWRDDIVLCFRDSTFCRYYEQCAHHPEECKRALTPKVLKEAREWWGKDNPPICEFAGVPSCFVLRS